MADTITFRPGADLQARLALEAARGGWPTSAMVRQAVEAWLDLDLTTPRNLALAQEAMTAIKTTLGEGQDAWATLAYLARREARKAARKEG